MVETGAPIASAQDLARIEGVLEVLRTGDQDAYERYIAEHWSPTALAAYSAEDHGSGLARIYAETGGFDIDTISSVTPTHIRARARARWTGIDHCVTLECDSDGITDLVVSALYAAGPDFQTPEPSELGEATAALAEAFDEVGEMSGVVLLARNDEVFFRRVYGKANIAYDVEMTFDTRMSTASIGKSFTGVAIAQLIDAGKLSFEDTVGAVLPAYPDEIVRDRVTIRQLLTHTAGLGDLYDHPRWPILRSRITTVPGYLDLVIGRPLVGEPGAQYEYSNAGYIVLGAIIEALSGQDFYDYVRDHIFVPAGMTGASYPIAGDQSPGFATSLTNFMDQGDTGYIYRLGRPRDAVLQFAARGGPQGGASCTADDLMAFDIAFRSGRLTSMQMVDLMTASQGPSVTGKRGAQPATSPGFGFEVTVRNGHRMIGHQGGDLGIASCVYHFPETGYTLVMMSNRDPRAVRVLLHAVHAWITRSTLDGATPPPQDCP